MKFIQTVLVLPVFLTASCGLENIEVLSINPSNYLTQTETDTAISYTIKKALFQGTNFKGFEILYKIMPDATSTNNLNNDIGKTYEYLKANGYFRLNLTDKSKSPEPLIAIPISLINDPDTSSDLELEISFSDMIFLTGQTTSPKMNIWIQRLNGTDGSGNPLKKRDPLPVITSSLYRQFDLQANLSKPFNDLLDATIVKDNDIDFQNIKASQSNNAEILFFIVAWGFDFTNGYERSDPIPLGIVNQISVKR